MAKRGKSYSAGQKEIVKKAFAKNKTPRQIAKEYPDEGFELNALKSMAKKWRKHGTIERLSGSGLKRKRTPKQIKAVKKIVEKNPNVSQSSIAKNVGVNKSMVRRIMKDDLELKTYKTIKAQRLVKRKIEDRLAMRQDFLGKIESGELAPKNIFFTDEKMFVWGSDSTKGGQNYRAHVHRSAPKKEIPTGNLARGRAPARAGCAAW